jgi:pectin methylesterase-like acyl-CoA thioesterase
MHSHAPHKALLRLFVVALLAEYFLSPPLFAQQPATAAWLLTDPATGGTALSVSVTGQFTASDLRLNTMDINKYDGPNSSIRIRMAGTGNTWPANQTTQVDTVYLEFRVSTKPGVSATIDSVVLRIGASSTNSMRANIYYSKDPTFASKTAVSYTTSSTTSPAGTYLSTAALDLITVAPNLALSDSESFYLRIYPWVHNLAPIITGKYICPQNVVISGTTTGSTLVLPPTVSTTGVSSISTTSAVSGGNISADGGETVTARGVCWNTSESPTVMDSHTVDGTGGGAFQSAVTGLAPGATYKLRAYATNSAGTSYGNELSFSTLVSIVPPTVTTSAASSVLVKSATSGGNVTGWGGAAVVARGVCWNTQGAPTTSDSKTVDGSGLGSFASALTGLSVGTKYFVRAYATNSVGTGYGGEISFTTQTPQRDTMVVVAKNGSGNYQTVQAAFRAVPLNYTGKWTIFVKKGTYYEKDTLAAGKVNVVLIGEDRDSTIITYDDYGDRYGSGNPGTSGSFSVAIEANDFVAKDLTFQNTFYPKPGVTGSQAVALRVNGDRQEYINCRLLGFQDTYYTWGGSGTGRIYHKNCFIEGTVDFIFGRNVVVFDSCTIHVIRNGGTITAASTDATSQYGYVFRNCTILADSVGFDGNSITNFYLGRPWQSSPRTVFLSCYEPATLHPAGWLAWNVSPALYAEFRCYGPGAASSGRVTWSSQLTPGVASAYSLINIFAKAAASSNHILSDWKPTHAMPQDNLPLVTAVEIASMAALPLPFLPAQNYPNPFNSMTAIVFRVSVPTALTRLVVFDLLGRQVAELINASLPMGTHRVVFDALNLPSGIYLYQLRIGADFQAGKMVLAR